MSESVQSDPDKVIKTVNSLLYLVEDTVDAFTDSVIDTTPEDLVPSVSLSAGSPPEVVPHVDNELDIKYLKANKAITKCIERSVPITELLCRVDYSKGEHRNASVVFTPETVSNLAEWIKDFNIEICRAQSLLDDLNKILKGNKLANAYVMAKSLVDAVNHIADAINIIIGQHNTYFHDVESYDDE